jgi:hypothetical protein
MSGAALGALRVLDETLVLVRWLLKPVSDLDRSARSFGLAMRTLRRDRRRLEVAVERAPDEPHIIELVDWMKDEEKQLMALAAEAGIKPELPPDRQTLFNRFHPEGYFWFAWRSELGSHPTITSSFAYFHDPRTQWSDLAYRRNLDIERGYWIAEGLGHFVSLCELTGDVREWGDWSAGIPVDRIEELGRELRQRWTAQRGGRRREQQGDGDTL